MSMQAVPTPPPLPKDACPFCRGRHEDLMGAVNCAAGHSARHALYAWADRETTATLTEVKALLGKLQSSGLGHMQAIKAAGAVLELGWLPFEDGGDS